MRRSPGRHVASVVAAILTLAIGMPFTDSVDGRPAAAITMMATDVAARAGITPGPAVLWESDLDQARTLDAIAATGGKWMSFDLDWNHIQYDGRTTWRWNAATDRVVLNSTKRGLSLIGMAAYSPPWARTSDCPSGELHCLAANPAEYGRFLGAAAKRYGSQSPIARLRGTVNVWQIWNEPNHREFSMPKPNLDRYTAMLKAAYVAIKAADPNATVITGATSPAPDAADGTEYQPETWLRGLYARGARGYFDAVGHHPYSFPVNPLDAHTWNAFTQTQVLYDVMVANGDGAKKIWGTEMGAGTGTDPQGVTEAQQAQWVRDYYRGWNTTFRSFTGPLLWFQLRDSGTNIRDRWQNLGLLRRDRTPKPSFAAYQEVMRDGVEPTPTDLTGTAIARKGRRAVTSPTGGFYTLAADGTVTAYDSAPYFGSPRFSGNMARGLVVAPDGLGYLVLDALGGVHKYGSATRGAIGRGNSGYFGFDIARDITLTPNGQGYAVLDGFGGVHPSGDAPVFRLGYWRGWDIARAFAYSPTGNGAYMLDAYGGVHVGGDARGRSTGYWSGWDIARDIVIAPDNGGYAVLDGFGGVHRAGTAPLVASNLAYRPWDHAGGFTFMAGGYVIATRS